MIRAGTCSNTNLPTLKMRINAKRAKCDGRTDTVTYRSRCPRQKKDWKKLKFDQLFLPFFDNRVQKKKTAKESGDVRKTMGVRETGGGLENQYDIENRK